MRRQPVYILIDTSGAMSGEPIEAVKSVLQTMLFTIIQDPYAIENVYISLITFGAAAEQLFPLTEVDKLNRNPNFSVGGGSSMGAALSLLVQCVDREVVKSAPDQKCDWKPLVFIMTNGEPTDNFEKGLSDFKSRRWGAVFACAACAYPNIATLQQIAGENVVRIDEMDSMYFRHLFTVVS